MFSLFPNYIIMKDKLIFHSFFIDIYYDNILKSVNKNI